MIADLLRGTRWGIWDERVDEPVLLGFYSHTKAQEAANDLNIGAVRNGRARSYVVCEYKVRRKAA